MQQITFLPRSQLDCSTPQTNGLHFEVPGPWHSWSTWHNKMQCIQINENNSCNESQFDYCSFTEKARNSKTQHCAFKTKCS